MNHIRRVNWVLLALTVSALGVAGKSPIGVQNGISVTVDGVSLPFSGTIVNGRVLVPLRGIFERLGAYVQWNPEKQQVVASRGQDTVYLIIGNTNATVDGNPVHLDVPAQIINGSTMVPIRFVSEAIGAQVGWRESERLVTIISNRNQTPPPPPPTTTDLAPPPPANTDVAPPPEQSAPVQAGPVRMARISWIDGGVTWRPGDDVDWSDAAVNLPLRQGAQVWLNPGTRAEIQFDDGSVVRLGNSAIAIMQTMFSDDKGEFTEIRLNTGIAALRLTNALSTYQVDTPVESVTAQGPANVRIDDARGLRVYVRKGEAQVQGDAGEIHLGNGDYLDMKDANSPFTVRSVPGMDSWDHSWDRRDGLFDHPTSHLPPNLALVGYDLDSYGTWSQDPRYGDCWRPRVDDPNWGPYRNGHWVWVSPFGWTWCASEPWGWTPYHYGTWFHSRDGWAWSPGPAQQYWSPAVVHFSTYNGSVAWCALGPSEVRYPPSVPVRMRSGDWTQTFSIGGAACYYPSNSNYCEPRPWTNTTVNRTTNIYNVTNITNIHNVYVSNNGFIPRASRVPGGSAVAPSSEFGHTVSGNHPAPPNADIFTKGQTFAAPTIGSVRYAGPTDVRPTAASFTPSHSLSNVRPNPVLINRQVIRAALPPAAAFGAKPMPNVRVLPRKAPMMAPTIIPPALTIKPTTGKPTTSKPGVKPPAKPKRGEKKAPPKPKTTTPPPPPPPVGG